MLVAGMSMRLKLMSAKECTNEGGLTQAALLYALAGVSMRDMNSAHEVDFMVTALILFGAVYGVRDIYDTDCS